MVMESKSKEKATTQKVLFVDDDALMRRIVSDRLSLQGYEVQAAVDGEEGLQFAQQKTPDIIISDVVMPKMDGFELCRRLRADPKLAKVPIIMLTSRSQSQDKVRGLDLGADDYLTKPFDPQELEARIRALLRRQ